MEAKKQANLHQATKPGGSPADASAQNNLYKQPGVFSAMTILAQRKYDLARSPMNPDHLRRSIHASTRQVSKYLAPCLYN
jgi:hypothetical protein